MDEASAWSDALYIYKYYSYNIILYYSIACYIVLSYCYISFSCPSLCCFLSPCCPRSAICLLATCLHWPAKEGLNLFGFVCSRKFPTRLRYCCRLEHCNSIRLAAEHVHCCCLLIAEHKMPAIG